MKHNTINIHDYYKILNKYSLWVVIPENCEE